MATSSPSVSGNKDEWHIRRVLLRDCERGQSIKGRQSVIRENNIEVALLQRSNEVIIRFDPCGCVLDPFRFEVPWTSSVSLAENTK
jgi:hypothetical protein